MCHDGSGATGATWVDNLEHIKVHQPDGGLAENVRNVAARCGNDKDDVDDEDTRTNLARCQADLSRAGYNSCALLLSPHQLKIPCMRWRAFILSAYL